MDDEVGMDIPVVAVDMDIVSWDISMVSDGLILELNKRRESGIIRI